VEAVICRSCRSRVMVRTVSYRHGAPPAMNCETLDSVGLPFAYASIKYSSSAFLDTTQTIHVNSMMFAVRCKPSMGVHWIRWKT
jgi:hypothetical protein